MRSLHKWIVATAVACSALGSSTFAQADDCNRVAFKFTNKWMDSDTIVDIRVQSVTVGGTDGQWQENINNQKINPHGSHTTKQRRLQQTDNGREADFTVNFEYRRANGPGWQSTTHGPFRMMCNDGDLIGFTIMHN